MAEKTLQPPIGKPGKEVCCHPPGRFWLRFDWDRRDSPRNASVVRFAPLQLFPVRGLGIEIRLQSRSALVAYPERPSGLSRRTA